MEIYVQRIAQELENLEHLGQRLDTIEDKLRDIDKSIAYLTDALNEEGE